VKNLVKVKSKLTFRPLRIYILIEQHIRVFFRSVSIIRLAAPNEAAFMSIALLVQGLAPALSVWITKQVVDIVTNVESQGLPISNSTLSGMVLAWIAALLLDGLLSPWVLAAQGNLNEKLSSHLNLLLMRKAESFPDLLHFENPRFYDELQLIQQQISRPLGLVASLNRGGREIFTIISMSVLLIPIGWWIPILILGTAFPEAYTSLKLQEKAWAIASRKSFDSRWLQYCTSLMLTDTYAKEIRLLNIGHFLTERYINSFRKMYQEMSRFRWTQALRSTTFMALSVLGNAFVFFWVVQQAFKGYLSAGNVLLFVQSLAYIQQNLSRIIESFSVFYSTILYMNSLFHFLDSKSTMQISLPGKPIPKVMKTGITFEKVHFSYSDGRIGLTDISFTLHSGETVALVGENGAGKTTIVKLLARLYDPTDGAILIDGEPLQELNLEAWREQIAIVFQDFGRYALTLGENIAFGELETFEGSECLQRAIQKSEISELVSLLPEGVRTQLGKQFNGTELSGGQWQKIALARAFLREKARILILDEPTAALDPKSESEVYGRFAELSQEKTTLLVTHRLASAQMADRILVLKSGKLIEQGTHSSLLQDKGEYAKLWEMQAKQYGFV
jgi:ATP-binding cassette, subfamily B, bacterial